MGHLQYSIGIVLVLALVCLKSSNALKCYQCNSYTDKRCLGEEGKVDEELLKECTGKTSNGTSDFKLCRKIKQIIDFEVNGLKPESRIIRTCGWDDSTYSNKCYQRSGFGGRQEVCACQDDACNGSPHSYPKTSVAVLLACLAALHRVGL